MAKENCYGSPHFDVSVGCPPLRDKEADATIQTLDAVVKDYKKMHYDNLETYLRDLKGDVRTCVYGPFKNYKKHPHQRRLRNDKVMDKIVSNIKEVKARNAYTIAITTKEFEFIDNNIVIDKHKDILMPILAVVPLQVIAFETAKLKGCDIDKPRNLAKSVTVE